MIENNQHCLYRTDSATLTFYIRLSGDSLSQVESPGKLYRRCPLEFMDSKVLVLALDSSLVPVTAVDRSHCSHIGVYH